MLKKVTIDSGKPDKDSLKIEKLVKDFSPKSLKKDKKKLKMVLTVLGLVLAGVGSGYFLSWNQKNTSAPTSRNLGEEAVTKGITVGVADEKTFRDSAEGKLQAGGLDGEGSHHLIRPGGETQTVYLTSSIIDLDKFVDHQVKVWGETFSAQKAAWLMDVGKLEVLE
ncbi:hypothetical protein COT75_04590 [Candidatus Beckwithbacteria bacterium CG10_big_fil_rev_8_21_14_0_10_34_10]|uniref:Uncharacterized protein n=1 Tax=Candidatus Beckwithbacteria bacterium CG10_big_fil_rev_8_21_14_0_10_34_10 TaxID=1974495 RepID=A0A2H0W8G3_9BACT|nr:MAG: hypothetical protein COT75_04590 [Candidatus Beckwithbacteria bacterium CG10_big_fil_rev_8_21_14_0_10_34_10]